MRLRKAVETLWEISRPSVTPATAKTTGKRMPNPDEAATSPTKKFTSSFSPFLTYIRQKIDASDSLSHRQIRSEVYTPLSVSNLRFHLTKEVSNGPTGTSR